MLVKMSAVEIREAVSVGRKVRRHPVENYGDSVLMQVVHQIHEILRRAITRCGCKIAGGLVSPGPVEGMLHYREKFNMGKPHASHVLGKARGKIGRASCRG